jgi:hypothetical protein
MISSFWMIRFLSLIPRLTSRKTAPFRWVIILHCLRRWPCELPFNNWWCHALPSLSHQWCFHLLKRFVIIRAVVRIETAIPWADSIRLGTPDTDLVRILVLVGVMMVQTRTSWSLLHLINWEPVQSRAKTTRFATRSWSLLWISPTKLVNCRFQFLFIINIIFMSYI